MGDERQSTSFESSRSFDPTTSWSAISQPSREARAPRHASESSGRWPALSDED